MPPETVSYEGLSPRMRGNLDGQALLLADPGSIPAHAGEPGRRRRRPGRSRVYPRACGGTLIAHGVYALDRGLSPRMRGNLLVSGVVPRGRGSIPAHAGEPSTSPRELRTTRVYPRACGGTGAPLSSSILPMGLSPRMRGNQYELARELPVKRVYPRACGGTLYARGGGVENRGSIPAHAGEPRRSDSSGTR